MIDFDKYIPHKKILSLLPPCVAAVPYPYYSISYKTKLDDGTIAFVDNIIPNEFVKIIHQEAMKRWDNNIFGKKVDKSSKEWTILGSRGASYKVKLHNGSYTCNCTGYSFRRNCKHIDEAKELNDGKKEVKKHIWTSPSGKTKYTIIEDGNKLTCSCPGFKKNETCTHVKNFKK